VSFRGKSGFLLISGNSCALTIALIGKEENITDKTYFNSDKKCGDNV
jgi:hypothetical protein